MSVIKKLDEKDYVELVNITKNAYPSFNINTQEECEGMVKWLKQVDEKFNNANLYGLYRHDQLLGGMILYDYKMNMLGHTINAGGVGMVAVDILHKKEKVAKELIEFFFKYNKDNNSNMVLLYPFRPDFYKKMGFGFGPKVNQYTIKPQNFPHKVSKEDLVYLSFEDRDKIKECYQRIYDKNHGMIEINDWELNRIIKNPKNKLIGYIEEGQVKGLMVFNFKQIDQDNFLKNNLIVDMLLYEDALSLNKLLTFLYTQLDQINHVIINTQDEYFHHILYDPRNNVDHIIPHVSHESNTQGVGLMYRVIDIKGLFNDLDNHNFNNQTCKLKLTVKDNLIMENDGSIIIHLNQGKAEIIEDIEEYDVEICISIEDFSSMIMGAINFKSLYNYGLVKISNSDYVSIINDIFYSKEKPICLTKF